MKNLINLLLAILLITGCHRDADMYQSTQLIPDISDLSMTENMQKIFTERRKKLMKQIENGIVILRSDGDFEGGRHEYRAANNFYYLTGFAEPGSMMVISTDGNDPFQICVKERTIKEAIYVGEVPADEYILLAYQPDTVILYRELDNILRDIIPAGKMVYIDFEDSLLKDKVTGIIGRSGNKDKSIQNVTPLIHEMRLHKDESEIARLQKAVDITGEAFISACRICRPGLFEFEMEAMIEYTFRRFGSPMPAFESIIASGPNATVLHYSANSRKTADGDLLLFDIGAEYGYYSADVSRTVPVNGKFTKEQRDIYELVLKAQKAAISEMRPGNHLVTGQNRSNDIIIQGLYELGLVTDPGSEWQKKFYILYPINHYLGMYVHDAGDYGASDRTFYEKVTSDSIYGRILEKGMVLTVEPGLYFRSGGLGQLFELFGEEVHHEEIHEFIDKVTPVYERHKNIGVRIEDDVLITEEGNVVLSANIPKETDEIEKLMRKR